MSSTKVRKIITAALMAAMTCIATMIIKVPSPTGGYIHLGDGFVLLSGVILGPIYGAAAAGIGSMFADLFSGYASFALATLVIKSLAAVAGCLVYYLFSRTIFKGKNKLGSMMVSGIAGGIAGGVIVTVGYLIFEAFIMGSGYAAAVAGVPFNIVQNIFGVVVFTAIMPLLSDIPVIKDMMLIKNDKGIKKNN